MYDGCFGLNRRPFASVPQIDQYFPAAAIEAARTILARSIQRGEGTGLVIGPSGTGKTLLCLLLAEQFHRSFQVVMLPNGRLSTRRALFQAILYELGRPYRGMDEGEARLAVVDYLMADQPGMHGLLLLVDEAHTLPLRLLEEIRMLTNLARSGQPLVRAVLAGGPVLEERFASPKLDSFSQRLSARCYLESLNRTETESYIHAQIDLAGGLGERVFPTETCQSVFQATGGVPRLVNQVCDHALLLAYVAGKEQIEAANIEEAWSDLQQLPTPWSEESKSDASAGGVIEFGALDDPADATPNTADTASDASPALRISPTDEEFETDDGGPVRQICRIERLLAEADDDFQPAGSIGPEIELCFEDAVHPFQEAYEHEEVVADRYAAAASKTSASSCASEAEGEVCCEAEPAEEGIATSDAAAATVSQEESEPDWECLPSEEELDSDLVAAHASATDHDVAGDWQRQEHSSVSTVSSRTPHREYRRLFAQLRRG